MEERLASLFSSDFKCVEEGFTHILETVSHVVPLYHYSTVHYTKHCAPRMTDGGAMGAQTSAEN